MILKQISKKFPQVYINNEYDTSTMASLDNSDEDEDEAEDEDDDDDEDEDEDEDEEEVQEKMVFSSSAGERMLISISGDRCVNILFWGLSSFFRDFSSPTIEPFPLLDIDA